MERIKDALERAKTNRDQYSSNRNGAGNSTNLDLTKDITYTETEVLRPDSEVFKRSKLLPAITDEAVKSAFKVLRTRVEQKLSDNNWNALAVTSPRPDEHKTNITTNLAIGLAWEMHRTVLLVDLNLRKPSIDRIFGIKGARGILNYLVDGDEIRDLLFNPGIERLVVLPAGASTTNSSELLSSPRMASLVSELKSRYPNRLIIFDLPPVLTGDDTIAFIPNVDCSLMVVEDGQTRIPDIVSSLELIAATNLLGICLTNYENGVPARGSDEGP